MVAPIAKNTVPSTSTTSAPAPAPARAPAAAPPPASDVRRQAADDVHTLQRTSAPSAPRASQVAYQRSIDQAVSTYLEGGGGSLRFQLGQDPAMLSALANVDPERLERDLEASFERQATGLVDSALTGLSAGGAVSIVESVANDRIRLGIVQEAQVAVNARIRDLQDMQLDLPQLVERLRNAAPGSADAIQAQALGIRGDGGDLQRARQSIEEGIAGLQTFMGHMRGQAWWETSDFPEATGRAARRLNLAGAEDAVNAAGVERQTRSAQVHHLIDTAEQLHILVEAYEIGSHVAQGVAVGAEVAALSMAAVGLIAGRAAYEFAEDVRAEHVTLGQSLGL